MTVHPWHILAGLGDLTRQELCEFLALFQDTSLRNLAGDRLAGINPFAAEKDGDGRRFQERLEDTARTLHASGDTDDRLRLMLWAELREALDCRPLLPLSLRSASTATADVAWNASKILAGLVEDAPSEAGSGNGILGERGQAFLAWGRKKVGLGPVPPFEAVVRAQAVKLALSAIEEGKVDDDTRRRLEEEFRQKLDAASPDLRAEISRRAQDLGDTSTLGLMAAAGSLVGLGVAVEVAGFGAYILAAQAAAVIPLLGGQTAVSALFVLANPWFIVPALVGGGWFLKGWMERSVKSRLAAGLAVLMALRGIAGSDEIEDMTGPGRGRLEQCLNGFRTVGGERATKRLEPYLQQIADVRRVLGGAMPAFRPAPGTLARAVDQREGFSLKNLLFPDAKDREDAAAVAFLTVGEVLYTAASIDPRVVAAVDFSRAEDLSDIFAFGAFADRAAKLPDAAAAGLDNNLNGYVAEQVVAAQLVAEGHDVALPETANNAGFDLVVDGAPVQVKCLSDFQGLNDHFAAHPDIPVIANAECVAEAANSDVAWKDMVAAVNGYDKASTETLRQTSMEAGEDLYDLDVPLFASAVACARGLHGVWMKRIPLSDLPFEVAVDVATKGSLAAVGTWGGQFVGLLVFGPAGAVVFGGVGGVAALFGASSVRSFLDATLNREWAESLRVASDDYAEAIRGRLEARQDSLNRKLDLLAADHRVETAWLRMRMSDDLVFAAEALARLQSTRDIGDPLDRASTLLRIGYDHAVAPWATRRELQALVRLLEQRPTSASALSGRVRDAGTWVRSLRSIELGRKG